MARVNREEFLKTLQSVSAGISLKSIEDQSSCFVFKNKIIYTFNEEIACRQSCNIALHGAVQAKPLIDILSKLTEEQIDLTTTEDRLIVKGKRRRARLLLEKEITLPIDTIKPPKKWHDLPNDFLDGIALAQEVAEKGEEKGFVTACVHIHPDYLEAAREYQVCRYKTKTPVLKPTMVRRESIRHITSLGMVQLGETRNWLHFKNPTGLILSCRRYVEEDEFPNTTKALMTKGTIVTLPKGIEKAVERAAIFTADNVNDNDIQITIAANKATVKGVGTSGDFTEIRPIEYTGKKLEFLISPVLLSNVVKRQHECIIGREKLKITHGKFSYVTVLGEVEDTEDK